VRQGLHLCDALVQKIQRVPALMPEPQKRAIAYSVGLSTEFGSEAGGP